MTPETLLSLADRVCAGDGPDPYLSHEIYEAVGERPLASRDVLGSPGACVALLNEVLPGFWWRGGTCSVSSEVLICPDHGDPVHRERLLRDFPPELDHWNEGVEVELRPGSNSAFCRAFTAAILRALAAGG